jgi:hypothetical protein
MGFLPIVRSRLATDPEDLCGEGFPTGTAAQKILKVDHDRSYREQGINVILSSMKDFWSKCHFLSKFQEDRLLKRVNSRIHRFIAAMSIQSSGRWTRPDLDISSSTCQQFLHLCSTIHSAGNSHRSMSLL